MQVDPGHGRRGEVFAQVGFNLRLAVVIDASVVSLLLVLP
jgi:hypothetical protein